MFTRSYIFTFLQKFLSDKTNEQYNLEKAHNSLNVLIALTKNIEPNAESKQYNNNELLLHNIRINLTEELEAQNGFQTYPVKIRNSILAFHRSPDSLHKKGWKNNLSAYLSIVDNISEELFTEALFRDLLDNLSREAPMDSSGFLLSPDDNNDSSYILKTNKLPYHSVYFLSYSFADKFYTFGLFILFLKEKGVLLYVDWIFKPQCNSTANLKKYIQAQMNACKGLILLRSRNSELRVGGPQIRQWCSWEMGTFFGTNVLTHGSHTDGYFINMFGLTNSRNSIIDNLREISDKNFLKIKL